MFVWFAACLFMAGSCKRIPFPWDRDPKDLQVVITDVSGKPVDEAYAGMTLKLVSPAFVDLNKQGLIKREGKIYFDKEEAQIREASGDYVLLTLPVLNLPYHLRVDISLLLRNELLYRCRACMLYRPTVSGSVFAGFTEGAADGTFRLPAEMTLDAAGNLYVIDQRSGHDRILRVSPAGDVTDFAGAMDEFGRLTGIAIDNGRGLLYVADAASQQIKAIRITDPATINVLAGSGAPGNVDGTGGAASFRFGDNAVDDFGQSETGQGMTIDPMGNLYVGEHYGTDIPFASQLRKITPEGAVTTVTGSRIEPMEQATVALPAGLSIGADNNIHYVSGSSGFFQGITRITPEGAVSRPAGMISFEGLADGTGAAAQFSYPKAIAAFGSDLYVADGTNGALRKVSGTGVVQTLAGVGHFETAAYCACPFVGPRDSSYVMPPVFALPDAYESAARAIRMNQAGGVAVQHPGLIYVSDYGYRCIWKIVVY